jgi:hypothetical protein
LVALTVEMMVVLKVVAMVYEKAEMMDEMLAV